MRGQFRAGRARCPGTTQPGRVSACLEDSRGSRVHRLARRRFRGLPGPADTTPGKSVRRASMPRGATEAPGPRAEVTSYMRLLRYICLLSRYSAPRALAACLLLTPLASAARDLWTPAQASEWYARQSWMVGANYIPASATNQLEMWQAETFDPERIDRELGWAESVGMNTVRVFLHDLLCSRTAADSATGSTGFSRSAPGTTSACSSCCSTAAGSLSRI